MLQTGTNYKISQEKRRKYPPNIAYYDASARQSAYELKEGLVKLFRSHHIQSRELVIMCIGSDRSTGDSLGPLIGYKLEKFHIPGISVRGTLSEPVHAANLAENLELINSSYRHPFVLAVDASLGTHRAHRLCNTIRGAAPSGARCQKRTSGCRRHTHNGNC